MKKILLFQPVSLGDAFFTSALADIIKENIKDCHISFYGNSSVINMIQDNPWIDSFILHTGNLLRDIINLRKYKFDFIFDTWAIGNAYYRMIFARAERKIFIKKKKSEEYLLPLVYTDYVDFIKSGYVFWDRIFLLKKLDIPVENYIQKALPIYHVREEIEKEVKDFLEKNSVAANSYILIAPKALWKTKDIPENLVVEITNILQNDFKYKVILTAHPSDREYIENINYRLDKKALLYFSSDIRKFGGLIKFSRHLISVESLPYHLAIGLRKSATVIIGGYPIWAPPDYPKLNFVDLPMDCKYCATHQCKRGDYKCLMDIKPQMVIEKVQELL
ncbi:glycosyltransferase family 9 protein [Persephonella sp. IF05-L8]|uniref:glycosyltransferase family 9 protein n=1 Tax=Persephonella sp. IF05-L8 TaxID=1158338 RepID=UPI00049583E1